ncbi:hypothetical protein [Acetobacter musti]|uniref:hypothetical protein n=1 Tax=Acetobacter musti TaxID=864732 RepID=UPI001F5532CE|nr:hypothetical protein [Acetobacter musti]
MKQHRVMLGGRVLWRAAQLSHAEAFAAARRAEGVDCHVVPDTEGGTKREPRINPLTGRPRRGSRRARNGAPEIQAGADVGMRTGASVGTQGDGSR